MVDIAEVNWLSPLTNKEISELISNRVKAEKIPPFSDKVIAFICEWAGCHPYLTQQMLNQIFDYYIATQKFPSAKTLIDDIIEYHDYDFSRWWNLIHNTDENQKYGGLNNEDRTVYLKLIESRKETDRNLARMVDLSRLKVSDALEVLLGIGVIRHTKNAREYQVGTRLFEEWIARQK